MPKEPSGACSNRPSPASTPPVVVTSATSVVPKSQSPEITKVQLEMQLRQQRAAMQLKRLNEKGECGRDGSGTEMVIDSLAYGLAVYFDS